MIRRPPGSTRTDPPFPSTTLFRSEVSGPASVHVKARDFNELLELAENLEGQLTVTIHGTDEDLEQYGELVRVLKRKAGRLIFNGFPTGVAVSHAMVHGGPYPATTFPSGTRSEEHTSELQSLMRISYAVFCLQKNNTLIDQHRQHNSSTK